MNGANQLNRSLGLKLAIVMVVGNIIGSGVYKKVAPMTDVLHSSGWVLICWVIAGIISLFGALSNAEVAGLLANTGGEYVYYQKIYNKFFAFLFGWSLFAVIQTAAISALAYVFAQSLNSVLHLPPVLSSLNDLNIAGVFYPFEDFNIKLTAIIMIILLTWINSRGVKTGAGLSTLILLLVFASFLFIIGFGLSSEHANIKNAFQLETTDSSTVGFSAVFTAMLAAFWAYQGWASVGFVGGEIKDANKEAYQKSKINSDGARIYASYCAVCHMDDGTGVTNLNAPLKKSSNVLGNKSKLIKTLLDGLKGGKLDGEIYSNAMPSHNFLTDRQIADVLTYIRSSFGNKASAVSSEEVSALRKIK